ncbi:MAG: SHOCT domain-containing protein [Calditrichia bacterium]
MHWIGGFWGGGIMMIFWWALIIVGIFALIKWILPQGTQTTKGESPLEFLKRRYARGEISKDEFNKLKSDLTTN